MQILDKISTSGAMPLFALVMGTVTYLYYKINSSKAGRTDIKEAFLLREQNSRFAPHKEIPEDKFLYPTNTLPFSKINLNPNIEKKITRLQKEIEPLQYKKMIKPDTSLSNTDLREMYGYSNLDNIIMFEQNYNKYINFLNEISVILIKEEQYDVAEEFLNEAVRLKSDVSKTYIGLVDIYYATNKAKLESFLKDFEKDHDAESFYTNKVINHVNNKNGL